jgi:thiamine-monophosphate kinase
VQLKDIGEFGLIRSLARLCRKQHPLVLRGIGDDAAVVRPAGRQCLLLTTDILREGIHFRRASTSPYLLGKKCISVNLSDIAAMGGMPRYYLVALSAPGKTPLPFVRQLYRGMHYQAQRFNAVLLGGDTTASPEGIIITITLIGTADRSRVVYRRGAREGDHIYVTGTVGDAALGLRMLAAGGGASPRHGLVRRHLDPEPRVAAGRRLAGGNTASSMIDISDGLVADLRHILEESRVGARISLAALPLSAGYRKYCARSADDFYAPALCGGEDYELLFTAHPSRQGRVAKIARELALPITRIGEITPRSRRIEILDPRGMRVTLRGEGYTHF